MRDKKLIDTLTSIERTLYDNWSKEEIYEAYLVEHRTRLSLNKELNNERRKLKEMKYQLEMLLKVT